MPDRLLAIDAGTKVVGFALADVKSRVVAPLYARVREGEESELATVVANVAVKEQCRTLVFGLPQGDGPLAREVIRVSKELETLGYTVATVDEHLTSRLARARAAEAGKKWDATATCGRRC